jgi:hypothetical protein
MARSFFSFRKGLNKNANGLPLEDTKVLFSKVLGQLKVDGYLDESFGFYCVDSGHLPGKIRDPELQILLEIRKKDLWPIEDHIDGYSEDDLFDMIEFLFEYTSKPIDGTYHHYNDCGMHWETFNKSEGQSVFVSKINDVLALYCIPYELSDNGEILEKPEKGFEPIFKADIPTEDRNVADRVSAAILRFRRHGSTIDDRRQAVRDLADVFEYLRPKVKDLISNQDERDLFNIANNFDIRHHNEKQKTDYDTNIWHSWMFYFYLSTIHVVLRKIEKQKAIAKTEEAT